MNIFNEETDSGWPEHERFPYNYANSYVEGVVESDLRSSKNPFMISGYASLARIIDFLASCHTDLNWNLAAFETIRILLGNEPYPTKAQEFRLFSSKFSQEIVDYWLERGVFPSLSVPVRVTAIAP